MRATLILLAVLAGGLVLVAFLMMKEDRGTRSANPAALHVASPLQARVGPLCFAWPPEGRAVVRAERRQNDEPSAESFDLEWRTLSSGDLLVESYRIEPEGERDPLIRSSWLCPDQIRVSSTGQSVSTALEEAARRIPAELLRPCSLPEDRQRELLGQRLATHLNVVWASWVGSWIGLELESGESRELPGQGRNRSRVRCVGVDGEGRVQVEQCSSSSSERQEMPFFLLDDSLSNPPGTSGPPEESAECWLESETGIEADLRIDGLYPLEIRTWARWTFRRSPDGNDSWGTATEESLYVFDWDPAEEREELLNAPDELPGEWRTRTREDQPQIAEAALNAEVEWWSDLWRQLTPRRRARMYAAFVSSPGQHATASSTSLDEWHEIRPYLRRMWLGE